eukprot:4679177-Amphidinium_carterae.1
MAHRRISNPSRFQLHSRRRTSRQLFYFFFLEVPKLPSTVEVVEGMSAHDGSYLVGNGVRVGSVSRSLCSLPLFCVGREVHTSQYVSALFAKDAHAPFILHFHGSTECAADYRSPELAARLIRKEHNLAESLRSHMQGEQINEQQAYSLKKTQTSFAICVT